MLTLTSGQETAPKKLRVEASSACQLKCPVCPTALGEIKATLGSGFLKATDFERLLDANPRVREIELSNYGEILLNPELPHILEIAYRKNISLYAENGVNLNTLKPEVLEALVKFKLRRMVCAIDGASADTYKIYRQGGDFDRVIRHIEQINALKVKYDSPFPKLVWQFIAFGHNEHELETARKRAAELGMEFYVKVNWSKTYSPLKSTNTVSAEAAADLKASTLPGLPYAEQICSQLWNAPQINWDGRVLGCCVNFWGDYGNAFKEGLSTVLSGSKMTHARQMLQGKAEARTDIPCTTCEYYQTMKRENLWLRVKKNALGFTVGWKTNGPRWWTTLMGRSKKEVFS